MNISENNYENISIDTNTFLIESFFHGSGTKTITVAGNTKFTYLLLAKEQLDLDLRIETTGETAEINVKTLCIAKPESDITLKLHAHLIHSHSTADLHMVSLLQDGSVCEIDGGVDLHADVKKISGHLLEENIILGENIKIKTLPMLDVRSSDVSASHGARIQRLDAKKMFYLQSRGLDKTQAKELMISGYFEQVFTPFKHDQENLDISRLEKEWLDYLLS